MVENARSGGRIVVDSLRRHDVEHVFCVPGESYLEILDALYDTRDEIAVVSCRHEHGAANMAEAYAKLTGKTGVCLVTRGPGACNAAIGVHTAFQDSTPMVLLVGQVPRPFRGREAFQEVDHARVFAPLAKWAAEVMGADDLGHMLDRAFRIAQSGRPGPVVLAIPEDVLREQSTVADSEPLAIDHPQPRESDMARLRALLEKAERPLVYIGGGGWTDAARSQIRAFIEASNLPVMCSFRRHDIFDNTHRNFVGEMGIGPDPRLVARVGEADLILAVGTRLGEMTTQGYRLIESPEPRQILVHVHAGAGELGRVFRPALGIFVGPAAFAEAAAELAPLDCARWRDGVEDARRDYEDNATPARTTGALDLGQVMQVLGERLAANGVVTVDAGNYSGWVQRYIRFRAGQRLLGPTSGAMGYAVPAAVAAKIAEPERMVVGCVGDGGFGMTGQELATAVLYGAAPIILIFNNRMYGTIRMHQERRYPLRTIATELANPDYGAVARAHGAHGETVERTADFEPAFERALQSRIAAVIELRTDAEQITTRTTITDLRKTATDGR